MGELAVVGNSESVIHGLTYAEYSKLPGVNFSTLKSMGVSPLHYLFAKKHPPEATDAMRIGSATHMSVFEPNELLLNYTVWDQGIRRGKVWDAFKEINASKVILCRKDFDKIMGIASMVRSHSAVKAILQEGEAETCFFWEHPSTGIKCKCRTDWINDRLIEFKTTRKVGAEQFGREFFARNYHMQVAFYRDAILATTGNLLDVVVIAAQNEPPFDVMVQAVPEEVLAKGRNDYTALLERLKYCTDNNNWPGIAPEEIELLAPDWVYSQSPFNLTIGGEDVAI